jgi:hypothetical protein
MEQFTEVVVAVLGVLLHEYSPADPSPCCLTWPVQVAGVSLQAQLEHLVAHRRRKFSRIVLRDNRLRHLQEVRIYNIPIQHPVNLPP